MGSDEPSAVAGRIKADARRTILCVERAVSAALERLGLIAGDRLLVALSGGPDSVALLHALKRLQGRPTRYQLLAAHLNHGLRGAESDRDEAFVRELCNRLGIQLKSERAALRPGSSNLEERAREIRYQFLNRIARAADAMHIMLGHHADDQAETVLLRLLRGSGVAGLSAMAEAGPGCLVRPLLSLRRKTLLAYLAAIDAGYVLDSSNLEKSALRNRLRNRLLPELEREYAPGIASRLVDLASEMRQIDGFIAQQARHHLAVRLAPDPEVSGTWRLDVRGFKSINSAVANAIIREMLRKCIGNLRRIERAHIVAMSMLVNGENPSARVGLPGGWRFRREYDVAVLEPDSHPCHPPFTVELKPGKNAFGSSYLVLMMEELAATDAGYPSYPWHPSSPAEAYLDAGAAVNLTARTCRPGDRIKPLGMRGSRKIQDVFVDAKIPSTGRRLWPLVLAGGEPVWIPGLVRSRLALVTQQSEKVVHLQAVWLIHQPTSLIATASTSMLIL